MKKVIVCIKEVPDADRIEIDHEKGVLKRENARTILNPNDEEALQWALKLKSRGWETTVLSMGPRWAKEVVSYALSLGIERGYLACDGVFTGSDTLATSLVLAAAILHLGADLVFFGHQTLDGDTGQVPQQVSEFLSFPCFTKVRGLEEKEEKLFFVQEWEEEEWTLEIDFPLALSFLPKKEPRFFFPSARSYFQEREIPILTHEILGIDPKKLGLNGSPTRVIATFPPRLVPKEQTVQSYSRGAVKDLAQKIGKTLERPEKPKEKGEEKQEKTLDKNSDNFIIV